VKSASGEVGMMLVPIIGIILLGFAWDLRSFIGLAIGTASVVFALYFAGLFEPVAVRVIAFQSRFAKAVEHFIDNQFRAAANTALNARYITAAIAFAALLSAMGIMASGRLPFSFFPPLASDQVIASLTMPLGTNAQVTNQGILQLEKSAEQLREKLNAQYPDNPPVRQILAALGDQPAAGNGPPTTSVAASSSARGHIGQVILQLTPSETRDLRSKDVGAMWRELNGPIADSVELKFNSSFITAGNDIDIQLEGDNVDELRIVAEKVRLKLGEYPGVVDITDSFRSGKQELKLSTLPSGEALGLTLSDVARQVRQAFYGEEAQRIQRGRDDVRVMVRYTEEERRSLGSLDTMRIRTPAGSEVPFATVAKADLGRGFSTIRRADSRRVVNVVADVDRSQITANEVIADLQSGPIHEIMAPYPRISFSLEGAQAEQAETVSSLIPLFSMAMFIIFALLAIPLRSYLQPLIIMSVIPFAFMGAVWGHLIMKTLGYVSGLAMMSVLGFVAATGVVVNSSLVLVHSVNYRRSVGESIHDAVLHASVSRSRPIILTSLTTFVGLMPLMFNKSVQAQFLVPMAVSLSFGVVFATLVTLLVVPSGYLILDDFSRFFKRIFSGANQPESSPTSSQ
jgi:multidrug efflux pump subunit AcrB